MNIKFAATLLAVAIATSAVAQMDVICVYYPHWHRYQKGDEWFGAERWKEGEWCFVKDAKPRFAGAKHPMRPYAGYLDESNPQDMAKDIALAANVGITVFLYDYYYYDGQVTQEAALEQGFLGAANRNRMKFALMWCYHERSDQFRPEIGKPRRRLMSLAHTKEEFYGLIDLSIRRYFPRPEYWRKDGKLFFSIYNFQYFYKHHGGNAAQVRSELDEARHRVRAAGLGEMHVNAQNVAPNEVSLARDCGFDSVTDYNLGHMHLPKAEECALRQSGVWETDYADFAPTFIARWEAMSKGPIPYIPQVTTGWDSTPRCRLDEPYPWKQKDYPYTMSFKNNTPNAFARMVAAAKAHAEKDPLHPNAIYVNGWNEYTEGTYLVPNNFDSDGFLRAIAESFGRHPANEYTYINPSSKQLLTVPAATYENVAYGAHSKQKVDVWLPKDTAAKTPVVVYFHGCGWTGGAIVDAVIGPKIEGLLKRGIAVVCVGYRYIQDAPRVAGIPPVKTCIDDCAAALTFVKLHASEWKLDTARIGLAGGSAGACTALILAYTDNNRYGIKALAPVIPQTSLDPEETREWIPNARYGGHAFGYRKFADWLAHREDCKDWIAAYSPAELARRISPKQAPLVVMRAKPLKAGEVAKDPTHSPVFVEKFAEICTERGLPCDNRAEGDAILQMAEGL